MPDATRSHIVLAAAVIVGLLVRLLDRGDADRNMGRLSGRFLGLTVVAVGVVYALGVLGVRLGPVLGALGVGGIALAFALVGALVPRRLFISPTVRLLDRGDADRNMGRLSGRFLGLTVVAVGVVYALGVAQADPDRT